MSRARYSRRRMGRIGLKVCLLLCQAGFIAEKEKIVSTPRGQVELDVYAIDPDSIDQISYVFRSEALADLRHKM